MARTVDPQRHQARRLQIVDAAITCFAAKGFDRTTTTEICRAAGIGSGTLFHYFPSKVAVLVAILELDTEEIRAFFADRPAGEDAWSGVLAYVRRAATEAADPRVAGFVNAVVGRLGDPAVAEALAENDRATWAGLRDLLARAQQEGTVRTDLAPDRLATWVSLLLDGFISRIATDPTFDPVTEADTLLDTVYRLAHPS